MGSGKSTVASLLSKLTAGIHIESDRTRKSIFVEPSVYNIKFGEGKYSKDNRQKVYEVLYRELREALTREEIVIIDASFSAKANRLRVREIAEGVGAALYWINCQLNLPELTRRLIERQKESTSSSEGRVELLESQLSTFESFDGIEGGTLLRVDTMPPPRGIADNILRRLKGDLLRGLLKNGEVAGSKKAATN